jgi:hypothetical protein
MLDINDFQENLVEYECVRIRDTRTVWLNAASMESLAEVLDAGSPDTSFARYFSYVPKFNRCFGETELDLNDRRIYHAERYGGRGVGDNGGGGRAGNIGPFQAKGIGPNPLARGSSTWHSYGSLNLIDAAYEAIYSTVLDGILPLGCARIHGVIHTSRTGALQSLNAATKNAELLPTSGALLVRERTLRPAHFMHAEHFAPPKPAGLMREPQRIRAVHRRLKTRFESHNHFIQFLGKFILSSAKQFGFARAARIAHGGVTPSNICLDGRWIDLTEGRFLSSGKNFRGLTPFYDEPQVIAEVVTQLMYVFGKSNVSRFNVDPLLRYFQSTFDSCFAFYSLCILGLPEANLSDIAESEDGKAFAKAYSSVILQGKRPVADLPDRLDPDDPVIAFMQLAYLSLADIEASLSKLGAILRCPPADALPVVTAFRNVFRRAIAPLDEEVALEAFRSQAIASAIKALRWAYLSSYFYRDRITSHLYHVVDNKELSDLGAFIQKCVDQSRWIFATACSGDVAIVETVDVRVGFDQARSVYTVTAGSERTFQRYEDCLAFINACHPDLRLSGAFDPFPYLERLAAVLANLERMPCIPA